MAASYWAHHYRTYQAGKNDVDDDSCQCIIYLKSGRNSLFVHTPSSGDATYIYCMRLRFGRLRMKMQTHNVCVVWFLVWLCEPSGGRNTKMLQTLVLTFVRPIAVGILSVFDAMPTNYALPNGLNKIVIVIVMNHFCSVASVSAAQYSLPSYFF